MLEIMQTWLIVILTFIVGIMIGSRFRVKQRLIHDYERGLLFNNGKFKGTLEAGNHLIGYGSKIVVIDMRQENYFVSQTVLTSDNIHIGINLTVRTKVSDAFKAFSSSQNFQQDTHDITRSVIKEVGKRTKTKTILKRDEVFENMLKAPLTKQLEAIGMELMNIELIDAVIPHSIQESIADSLEDLVKKEPKKKAKVGFIRT